MEIRLYNQFSKKANSTERPSGAYTSKDVRLKEGTSILEPTFLLSNFTEGYNYIFVPKWNRYYFVNNVVLNITGTFEISCTCDRLATFKNEIGNYSCFVERCSNVAQINNDIADATVSSSESVIDVKQAKTSIFNGSAGVVVCRTINASNGISTFIGSLENFKDLFNPNMSSGDIPDIIQSIFTYYMCNPGDYVLDTYFLAVPLAELTSRHAVTSVLHSGWYSGGGAFRWNSNSPLISDSVILNKPSPRYQDWRGSHGAFTQYSIYLPSVGEVPLSGDIIDNTLSIDWSVDINTGEMVYFLHATDSTGDKSLIATYHGNVKSGLQVGSMMPNGSGIITSGAGLVASGLTGNPIAIGTSVINVAQNFISPSPSINGAMGSCAGILTENQIVITRLSKGSGDTPNTLGKPCCKNLTLSTIPGFIKCSGSSIEIAGYESDKNEVNSLLDSGFYYE